MTDAEKKSEPRQAPGLIKEIKKRFGFTQPDLALILGISQPAVSQYEAGRVKKEQHDVIKTLHAILSGEEILKVVRRRAQELKDAQAERLVRLEKAISERTGSNDTKRTKRS